MKREEKRAFRVPFPRSQMRDNFSPLVSSALIPTTNGVILQVFRVRPTSSHIERKGKRGYWERERENLGDFTVLRANSSQPVIFSRSSSNVYGASDNCRSRRRNEQLIWIDRQINRRVRRFTSSNGILSRVVEPPLRHEFFAAGLREDVAIKSMLHEYRISCYGLQYVSCPMKQKAITSSRKLTAKFLEHCARIAILMRTMGREERGGEKSLAAKMTREIERFVFRLVGTYSIIKFQAAVMANIPEQINIARVIRAAIHCILLGRGKKK